MVERYIMHESNCIGISTGLKICPERQQQIQSCNIRGYTYIGGICNGKDSTVRD